MRRMMLVAIAVFALAAPAALATYPGQNGKILFGASDSSGRYDIWSMNPDGTGRTQITTTPDVTEFGRWSPDGTEIVFRRFDFTTSPPGPWQVWTMNADGSNQTNVTPDVSGPPFYDARVQPTGVAWSPDGTKIAITNEDGCAPGHSPGQLILIDPDGSNPEQVVCRWPYVPPGTIKGAAGASPNWSPDGNKLTVSGPHSLGCQADTWTVNRDGTNLTDITQGNSGDEAATDWSPDGARIATFEAGDCADSVPPTMWTMKTDGTDRTAVPIASAIRWTPDNTKFAFTDQGDIWTANLNGTGRVNLTNTPGVSEFISDWLAVPNNAYARPRGATPARVSLVTAYNPCTSPDRTHGPPLAFPSCSSPQQSSSQLTVGTGDANGKPALNEGYLTLAVQAGAPGGADDSDVTLDFFLDDVFTNALADYTGNLRVHLSLQITDRLNTPAPSGASSATSVAIPVDMTVPCVAVPDPNEGSTCTANTSVDALIPGAVPEGRRAIWQLGAVQVYDAADTLFATQGVFIP